MTAHREKNTSRGASAARKIVKKRDRPYKIETSRVIAKRRKLEIQNTDQVTNRSGDVLVPRGFRFLPIGLPELSNRCKELSRLRSLPVNVVNAKPATWHGDDPDKISYHIRRLGYHFRGEIVDEACKELGFVFHNGKYSKADSLDEEYQQQKLEALLIRHGVQTGLPEKTETHEQIKMAIKDLFPNIPDDDLEEVIKTAWDESRKRVGTNKNMSLPRRVQLAILARIRHVYTDYDNLLKAFHDWADARATVEPVCLEKLKEWRGENDPDTADDELEEIIRETIVIDDDDDDIAENNSDADDEDSVILIDSDSASETSLEITYSRIHTEELRPESIVQARHQLPYSSTVQTQYANLGNGVSAHSTKVPDPLSHRTATHDAHRNVHSAFPINTRSDLRTFVGDKRDQPESILIDGRLYKKAKVNSGPYPSGSQPTKITHPANPYANGTARPTASNSRPLTTTVTTQSALNPHSDRPVQSIERSDESGRHAVHLKRTNWDYTDNTDERMRRTSPEVGPSAKRRRLENPIVFGSVSQLTQPNSRQFFDQQQVSTRYGDDAPNQRRPFEAGPPPQNNEEPYTLPGANAFSRGDGRAAGFAGPGLQDFAPNLSSRPPQSHVESGLLQYGPSHRRVLSNGQDNRPTDFQSRQTQTNGKEPANAQIAPVQFLPRAQGQHSGYPQSRVFHRHSQSGQPMSESRGRRIIYVEEPRPRFTPLPLHGEPALIQQMPRVSHQFGQPTAFTRATLGVPALSASIPSGNVMQTMNFPHPQ